MLVFLSRRLKECWTLSSEPAEDLRAAQRLPASAVPAITGLRIQGQKATLINISETGLLAECGERQMPGNRLTVMVECAFAPATMRCRVTRTSVAALGSDGKLRYHVGVQFDSRITLDVPAPAVPAVPDVAVAAVDVVPAATPGLNGGNGADLAASVPAEIASAALAPAPPAREPVLQNRW
jgi:hypothetical protein